jgi:hypothetical protein
MTMMDRSETNAGRVRALFERRPSAALVAREIYQGVGATTPTDRDRIRSALTLSWKRSLMSSPTQKGCRR